MEMVLIFTFCLILAGTDAVPTVTGYRGRSVQIKCSYTSGYEKNNKYLCRAKVFTVTITDLRPEEGGTYWCGVDAWHDKYTEILLLVKTDNLTSTVSHTTHTTHTTFTTNITHTNSTHSMSLSVHAENTHSTTANPLNDSNHPNSTPSSQDFSTSTIITSVSVVLVLLLIVLLFAVAFQRKKKTRASSPTQPAQSSSNHNVVPHPDYIYDEIKDNISLTNTLYSTALTPTNPSEIYSEPKLPTIHSDNSQAVYTTVDHPSDPPDQDFYSTAHLPTIPSDSSVSAAPPSGVKSGESLTYAAVSFDTDSNGAAPAVIYKHKNNSCEYDTVNDAECG
ncbi:CMRF35-like molecule 1 [Clarias gariepinus]|uniref:CMRF35-like molecule 1 n=1 Tax=Clarias gariepinus TaxID=13013 RepID=UPI00234DB672|nr:CMRF35-like molecule 1 [Clarias gariepinus]